MTTTISRPPVSDRLVGSKVIAVLRASHVSALVPGLRRARRMKASSAWS